MDLGLTGKVAVMAAASRGLGRAVALELAREGAKVAICSRGGASLEAARREIAAVARGGVADVTAVSCDLDTAEGPRALVKAALDCWARLDIVVANNGGPPPGSFDGQNDETWTLGFRRSFLGTVRLVRAALPHLERAAAEPGGFARVVALTSSSVREPIDGLVLSNAMRAAVSGAMKTLAREVGRRGITVNQVCPGRIATDRLTEIDDERARTEGRTPEDVRAGHERSIPLGRYGRPEELAAVVAFLCSARASYLHGTTVTVDGGLVRGAP